MAQFQLPRVRGIVRASGADDYGAPTEAGFATTASPVGGGEATLPATLPTDLPHAVFGAPQELPELPSLVGTVPVQYVPPGRRRDSDDFLPEEGVGLLPSSIQLKLPGPQRLFRLESEAGVRERIRQESRQRRTPDVIEFPEELHFEARELVMQPRNWPVAQELVEPGYVWHGRLPFEQINSERYAWSTGALQPAISALHFYLDVAALPYRLGEDPCRAGDTNAGKCLPGDPVPLLLYPPGWSLAGFAAEAAVAVPLFFVFP
jgi:hypothetical protein